MHSAGSGAYKMRVYQPHQAIVLEANASSPTGAPKIKSIIIKTSPTRLPPPADPAGDADMARDLGADQIAALQDKPGVKVLSIPSAEQNYRCLIPPTAPTRCSIIRPSGRRRAGWLIMRASPKSAERPVLYSPKLPAGRPAGALETNPFTFDPQKLRLSLIKRALRMPTSPSMWRTNRRLSPSPNRCRPALPGGVKVDLLPAAGSVYARVRAKQHQAAIRLWIPDYFDAHSNASAFAGTMVNPAPWPGSTAGRSLS